MPSLGSVNDGSTQRGVTDTAQSHSRSGDGRGARPESVEQPTRDCGCVIACNTTDRIGAASADELHNSTAVLSRTLRYDSSVDRYSCRCYLLDFDLRVASRTYMVYDRTVLRSLSTRILLFMCLI